MGCRKRTITTLLIGAALVAACDTTGPGGDPEPAAGLIAYASGFNSIYTVRPDGKGTRLMARATSGYAGIGFPRWSPDGLFLAYVREDYSNALTIRTLEIIRRDGTQRHNFLPAFEFIWSIVWAPDGDRLVLSRDPQNFGSHPSGASVLYTVRKDGTEVHPLPYLVYNRPELAKFHCPSWSPDGSRIAFVQQFEALWNTRSDGSDPLRLFEGAVWCSSWSPAGDHIAFVSDSGYLPGIDAYRPEIYLINPDGSGLVRLTEPGNTDTNPVWSPDGSRLAFTSTRDGNPEIYLMQADGSGLVRITTDLGSDDYPTWSPDGTRLAFASNRGGNWNIHVIGADGTGLRQLSHGAADEYAPAWR